MRFKLTCACFRKNSLLAFVNVPKGLGGINARNPHAHAHALISSYFKLSDAGCELTFCRTYIV